jgi:hypothetical protein
VSNGSSVARSEKLRITFSTVITAMCTRGQVLQNRPFLSFVTTTSVPVSATAKLTPVIPRSPASMSARRWTRAHAVSSSRTTGSGSPASTSSTDAICSSVLWIAGVIMCDGRSPATWTMNSPRSVSTTRPPESSMAVLRSISSVAIDLPLMTLRAPADSMMPSTAARASEGVAHRWTTARAAVSDASRSARQPSRSPRVSRRIAAARCFASPCTSATVSLVCSRMSRLCSARCSCGSATARRARSCRSRPGVTRR